MLHIIFSIVGVLITILFVVGTHEYAHFLCARLLGVKVLRFSIGFGKRLWHRYDKHGTEYVIALVPLGGYVKMLDENEGEVSHSERHLAYNRQPFYKKFLIVIAGPLTNILCAFILYWLIFMMGFVTVKPTIGLVAPHSIAANGGLKENQTILSIDNITTASWTSVMMRLLTHAGNHDELPVVVKNNQTNTVETHILDLANWHLDSLAPDPLSSLGITPYAPQIPLIIGILAADSPAAQSHLQLGDTIVAIDEHPMKDWDAIITMVYNHPDQVLNFSIKRQKSNLLIPVIIGDQRTIFWKKTGYLGIGPKFAIPPTLLAKIKYGPIAAIPHAWQQISDFTYLNLVLFGKMFTGKLSLQSLGGPITIFESAGNALNYGFVSFIGFLAFLSISIGVINLIPIPGLDGGHILIQALEFIIGKPLSEKVLMLLYQGGFLFLIFVLIQAFVNDIMRL